MAQRQGLREVVQQKSDEFGVQLLSNELPPTFRIGRQASGLRCFPELAVWGNDVPTDGIIRKFFLAMPSPDWICLEVI